MNSESRVIWVNIAKRVVSPGYVEDFEKIIFNDEKLYRDALLSYVGKGYRVL